MKDVPLLELNDGHTIPQLGLGVYQIAPENTVDAVLNALEVGYRHIDTAEMYGNEKQVGEAINESEIGRSDIFVTSKLHNAMHKPDDARRAIDNSIEAIGSDYIDLFLIHWPLPKLYGGDFLATWEVLEDYKSKGHLRSIGVSNFQVSHLQKLIAKAKIEPAVNQIELHPYFQNVEVDDFGQTKNIATEAWSPIAQGGVLDDPVIAEIAKQTGKSTAQVVLRWHIQRGNIIFPKSETPERIEENYDIFDFELNDNQMADITGLDKAENGRTGPHPDRFDYCPEYKRPG